MARRSTAAAAAGDPPAVQPAANKHRGEHSLTLAGVTYVLRPSHAVQVEIEEKTGQSAVSLTVAGEAGRLPNKQLGIIAGAMIRAGAADELTRRVDDSRIGELIFEAGTIFVMGRLTAALTDMVTGGRTASGEAKAAGAPEA